MSPLLFVLVDAQLQGVFRHHRTWRRRFRETREMRDANAHSPFVRQALVDIGAWRSLWGVL